MNLSTFLHRDANAPTTISEIRRIHEEIAATDFLGLYAYATQSGAALFDLTFAGNFWADTPSRWLFGIDYGRTQPQALRLLCSRPNVDVRIHDGMYVLDQSGFVPRRDFHAKMAMLLNQEAERSGAVVGSGNFSSNGLRKSVEAGASVITHGINEFDVVLRPTLVAAELLWEQATPVADILDVYEERWSTSFFGESLRTSPTSMSTMLRHLSSGSKQGMSPRIAGLTAQVTRSTFLGECPDILGLTLRPTCQPTPSSGRLSSKLRLANP
ncbi:phospholipase D family protein [Pseudomonas aeruginosa]|nr:phospholipase D family protein [Pseudomonas aeruginosa]MDF5989664.1 phospholipase D family protein [Pseudomonas aeruginosa]MDF5996619.1 phospholipase D family protein [Pseudomonas aeruginosa]